MATRKNAATAILRDLLTEMRGMRAETAELKGEMVTTRKELAVTRDALRGEIAETRDALRGEIAETRDALGGELTETRDALRGEIAQLREETVAMHHDLKIAIVASRVESRAGLGAVVVRLDNLRDTMSDVVRDHERRITRIEQLKR